MKKFRVIEHTADIGIEAFGRDLNELFANAAYGMFSILCDIERVRAEKTFQVKVSSQTPEELLRSWLDELLYEENTREILFCKFEVKISDRYSLSGRAFGEKINLERHRLKTEIKAVTYHQLEVQKCKINGKSGYKARIIFDV